MGRRSGLGRGLEALIPTTPGPGSSTGSPGLTELPIDQIEPNHYQPRSHFDEEALDSLAASIRQLGILQPVLVRPVGDDRYELIAGERRWRAAKRAGLTSIPALVRAAESQDSLEQALVENLHREDLSPLEEAAAYDQLMKDFSLSQEQVASRVGKSRSAVANAVRLLQLPPEVQQLLATGALSAGHARPLLALSNPDQQRELAERIVREEWTVRRVEEEVRRQTAPPPEPRPGRSASPVRPAALLELEELLSTRLDTRVTVELRRKRGRVIIDFADLDDLERIYRAMVDGREEDRVG